MASLEVETAGQGGEESLMCIRVVYSVHAYFRIKKLEQERESLFREIKEFEAWLVFGPEAVFPVLETLHIRLSAAKQELKILYESGTVLNPWSATAE